MARLSKVDKLLETLKQDLRTNPWTTGERYFSEHQLCAKYNVSRQTVRKATDVLVEDNLLVRVKGSGTFVTEHAVSLRQTKTHSIGILVTYLSDYIFPTIIKELERSFSQAGFTVQLASTANSSARERVLLQQMLNSGVDGIILEPTKSALPNPNVTYYQELEAKGFPMICIHSRYPGLNLPVVGVDDEEAGFLAAKHLLEKQHRRIAAVLKSDDLQGHARYRGILKAHQTLGINFDDRHVYWYSTEDISSFEAHAQPVLERLRGCSAVIAYNDQMALPLQKMLMDAGQRIPEDFAMASIDDSKYANYACTPLTSVRSPSSQIGITAADHLLRLIRGEVFTPGKIFTPTLNQRQSS